MQRVSDEALDPINANKLSDQQRTREADYAYKMHNTSPGCDANDLYGKREDPISNFAPGAFRGKIWDM